MAKATGEAPSWRDVQRETGFTQRGMCRVCTLDDDIRSELHDAWASGMRATFCRLYLERADIKGISEANINHHFSAAHHEREAS